jgi:hypothetical protein
MANGFLSTTKPQSDRRPKPAMACGPVFSEERRTDSEERALSAWLALNESFFVLHYSFFIDLRFDQIFVVLADVETLFLVVFRNPHRQNGVGHDQHQV